MDNVSRWGYELLYKIAFAEKTGEAFQEFFSAIMEKRYLADYVKVQPYGPTGDQKNDGYIRTLRFLFQCYAPVQMNASITRRKVQEDFTGAKQHWLEHFDTWIFVHNAKKGIPPQVLKLLLELSKDGSNKSCISWGFEELRNQVFLLDQGDLQDLLGPVPSTQSVQQLGNAELLPVLLHLDNLRPPDRADIRPVPANKIIHNRLGPTEEGLLITGMVKAGQVAQLFRDWNDPELGDRIAAWFNEQYRLFVALGLSSSEIYGELRKLVLRDGERTVQSESASLAILSYLFESCDIFERPPESESLIDFAVEAHQL